MNKLHVYTSLVFATLMLLPFQVISTISIDYPILDIGAGHSTEFGIPKVWVINAHGQVARHLGGGSTEEAQTVHAGHWEVEPGRGTRIDVGPADQLWVVNSSGHLYKSVENGWERVHVSTSDVGVGANGHVWIINRTPVPGGFQVERLVNGKWKIVSGGAIRIDVGPQGYPWIVNNVGDTFRWNGGGWIKAKCCATDIAVGRDGNVYVTGIDYKNNSQPYEFSNSQKNPLYFWDRGEEAVVSSGPRYSTVERGIYRWQEGKGWLQLRSYGHKRGEKHKIGDKWYSPTRKYGCKAGSAITVDGKGRVWWQQQVVMDNSGEKCLDRYGIRMIWTPTDSNELETHTGHWISGRCRGACMPWQ